MCNKVHHVKRFYTLMFMTPTVLRPRCIGVYKSEPTELQIKAVLKRHVTDPVIEVNRGLYSVDVVPVDIPLSILF